MQDDATKKTDQSDRNDRAPDKVEELPQQPISDRDAQAVKGGMDGATKQKVISKI